MNKLSDASEKAIAKALTKAADLVNEGASPDDAIVKVATELRIPYGHVRLMAHAYNNGRSIGHFRAHADLQEKAASFALADSVNILQRMFPAETKTATEAFLDTVISDDYSMSPVGWIGRRVAVEKRAEHSIDLAKVWGVTPGETVSPRDPEIVASKAISNVLSLKKEASERRQAVVTTGYQLGRAFDALVGYFKTAGCLPFPAVQHSASLAGGARAKRLLERIAHENPQFTKQASRTAHNVDWTQPPYVTIAETLQATDKWKQAQADASTFEKEATEKSADHLRPFVQASVSHVITGSVWDARLQTEKQAIHPLSLGVGAAIGGGVTGMARAFVPKPRSKMIDDRVNALAGTEHEEKLREIRTKTMLHDLMLNDPVISGYSPEQVTQAFNRISDATPYAAQKHIMLQALLRKYLEQGNTLEQFDTDQALDMDKKLRQAAMMTPAPVEEGMQRAPKA